MKKLVFILLASFPLLAAGGGHQEHGGTPAKEHGGTPAKEHGGTPAKEHGGKPAKEHGDAS